MIAVLSSSSKKRMRRKLRQQSLVEVINVGLLETELDNSFYSQKRGKERHYAHHLLRTDAEVPVT